MKRTVSTVTALALLVGLVAAAPEGGEIAGRVLDARGKPVAEATVLANVKTWPDGRFRMRPFSTATDGKGRFRMEDCVPPEERYQVNLAVVATGHAFVSRYVEADEGGPFEPLDLKLPKALSFRLRFTNPEGKPVEGVVVGPAKRVGADEVEHIVYAQGSEAIRMQSSDEGEVEVHWFAKGDRNAEITVRFPDTEVQTRTIELPKKKGETVVVPSDPTFAAGGDARKRFFLLGPKTEKAPKRGYGLLLVLPGGDGSTAFHPFVKNVFENAVGEGWLLAQPVAVKWTEDQQIVWPTAKSKASKMKFTTEELIAAVVKEVGEKHDLDPRRIFTLSWSSSGPACYAASLAKGTPVTGSFVAMSVFKPDYLPSLGAAKGHAYYIYHSKEDRVCPFRMAEDAREKLEEKGAEVEFRTYEGGHGWHGDVFGDIRAGLAWLERAVK